MPTSYAGVSTYDATIQIPNDGEDADALSLHGFAEPLANRTKYLFDAIVAEAATRAADDATETAARIAGDAAEAAARAAADAPLIEVATWLPFSNPRRYDSATIYLGRSVWNPIRRKWYSVGGPSGGNDKIYSSTDGLFWVAETFSATTGQPLVAIDVNPTTGTMVAVGDNLTYLAAVLPPNVGSWGTVSMGAATYYVSDVKWSAQASTWIAVGRDTSNNQRSYYAAEAGVNATWTVGGLTTLTGTGIPRVAVSTSTGRLVASNIPAGGTSFNWAVSDDGGASWTNTGTITGAYSGSGVVGTWSAPGYSLRQHPATGRWLLVHSDTSSGSNDVGYSDDNMNTVSFLVSVADVSAVRGGGLAPISTPYGDLWAMYGTQYLLTNGTPGWRVSSDGGATWRRVLNSGADGFSTTARTTAMVAWSGTNLLVTGTALAGGGIAQVFPHVYNPSTAI